MAVPSQTNPKLGTKARRRGRYQKWTPSVSLTNYKRDISDNDIRYDADTQRHARSARNLTMGNYSTTFETTSRWRDNAGFAAFFGAW